MRYADWSCLSGHLRAAKDVRSNNLNVPNRLLVDLRAHVDCDPSHGRDRE